MSSNHRKDLEDSILGGLMMDNDNFAHAQQLTSDYFAFSQNKVIWGAIYQLGCQFKVFDSLIIINELKKSKKLGIADGETHIYDLCLKINSPKHTAEYIKRLIELHNREKLIKTADTIKQAAKASPTYDEALVESENHMLALRETNPVRCQLKALTLSEIEKYEFNKRDEILSPWLMTQSINMIYAARGVGKTFVALEIMYAVASGGKCFHWEARRPHKVVFIDGEMSGINMKERIEKIKKSHANVPYEEDYLKLLTQDSLPDDVFMPDLATTQGQAMLEPLLKDRELIILDNISTLFPSHKENEADSWAPIQCWLLKLRKAGKSVLLIHHAGKNGGQRGSSRKEDVMDCVISLARDKQYSEKDGASFVVEFKKNRHIAGEDVEPMKITMQPDRDVCNWQVTSSESEKYEHYCQLAQDDLPQAEIIDELEISRSTFYRYKKRFETEVPE